jgi:hypothetical protein
LSQDLNQRPPEYEAGALTTWPQCLVLRYKHVKASGARFINIIIKFPIGLTIQVLWSQFFMHFSISPCTPCLYQINFVLNRDSSALLSTTELAPDANFCLQ